MPLAWLCCPVLSSGFRFMRDLRLWCHCHEKGHATVCFFPCQRSYSPGTSPDPFSYRLRLGENRNATTTTHRVWSKFIKLGSRPGTLLLVWFYHAEGKGQLGHLDHPLDPRSLRGSGWPPRSGIAWIRRITDGPSSACFCMSLSAWRGEGAGDGFVSTPPLMSIWHQVQCTYDVSHAENTLGHGKGEEASSRDLSQWGHLCRLHSRRCWWSDIRCARSSHTAQPADHGAEHWWLRVRCSIRNWWGRLLVS